MEYEWDLDTIMHSDFNGDAGAGNVDYSVYQSSALRIKRRRVGKSDWLTLREIEVRKPEDFSFYVFDILAKSETTYEYAIVPVINSIEGAIVSKQVDSKFDGIYIADPEQSYHAVMDISLEKSRVNQSAPITTLSSKYPYMVRNSRANYSQGKITAFFLPVDSSACGFTTVGAIEYREKLDDFLTNNNTKIIKDAFGRMWLAQVVGGVQESMDGHPHHTLSSFEWTEIGDCEGQADLYNNGFVDVAGA